MDEDALIAELFAPLATDRGADALGDDAAAFAGGNGDIVVTCDALAAGVHFFPDDPPEAIAAKALRVNLSDLAAKGAEPFGYLLALALGDGWTANWARRFAAGLGADQARYGVALFGGDTLRAARCACGRGAATGAADPSSQSGEGHGSQSGEGRSCQSSEGRGSQSGEGRQCQSGEGRECQSGEGRQCQSGEGRACQSGDGRSCQCGEGRACQSGDGRSCQCGEGRAFECREGRACECGEGRGTTIAITAFGRVPTGGTVRRRAARPGDRIVVTGTIGDAALGLVARLPGADPWPVDDVHRAALDHAYLWPDPPVVGWAAVRAYARAAMDVSDGLVGDLAKLCRTAGVGARLDVGAVPLSAAAAAVIATIPQALDRALTGGDDYQILAAVAPEAVAKYRAALTQHGVMATEVGEITAGSDIVTVRDGRRVTIADGRFQHF